MQPPEPETRAVVRNVVREAIAVGFVLMTATLFLGMHVAEVPITVEMGEIAGSFITTFTVLFIGAAGYLVYGEQAIRSAAELVSDLRGGE